MGLVLLALACLLSANLHGQPPKPVVATRISGCFTARKDDPRRLVTAVWIICKVPEGADPLRVDYTDAVREQMSDCAVNWRYNWQPMVCQSITYLFDNRVEVYLRVEK